MIGAWGTCWCDETCLVKAWNLERIHFTAKHVNLWNKKVSGFWSPRASPQTRASVFLIFFFFAMKRCPIAKKLLDRLEFCRAVLRLYHIGVWTFTRFVRPLLAPYFENGKFGPRICNVSRISMLAKKDGLKKARHLTDFEANRWPETGYVFGL